MGSPTLGLAPVARRRNSVLLGAASEEPRSPSPRRHATAVTTALGSRRVSLPPSAQLTFSEEGEVEAKGRPEGAQRRKSRRCGAVCQHPGCRARIPLGQEVASRCRCGAVFCARHMHAHHCQFDYKADGGKPLMEKCVGIRGNSGLTKLV